MKFPERRFAIATSTRADWGLLSPLARGLRDSGMKVDVLATNMHLLSENGMTVDEIETDGFEPIKIPARGTPAEISAQILAGFSEKLGNEEYEAIVILGDRFEMLSVAQAAVLTGIPIIHIAGGTTSEGAFDEYFRHAITKMAWLHLTETELCRKRVVQMGESPERVFATGALGVARFINEPLMPIEEVEKFVGIKIDRNTLLLTLHHESLSAIPFEQQYEMLFAALDGLTGYRFLFTYPNNDVNSGGVIRSLKEYEEHNPGHVSVVPSLGYRRYISAVRNVGAVVGNSSSGLVEVPSTGTPTLNIGHRQDGRECGPSVIHCGSTTEEIASGLQRVLSDEHRQLSSKCENPYFKENTLQNMLNIILSESYPKSAKKKFYEL